MVRIRLSRAGAKGRPFYHVVVTDQRSARDGRSIERLGYFNPGAAGAQDKRLVLDVEKLNAWVAKGAQCSDKVTALAREAAKQTQAA
ncbi:MAG TPA: 30S ribosomal protein S16 [Rhodanobacteraceae bacterium]|nr:30S ribosomal protein S16 [Rhodanobacteraceae bacterium]